MKEKIIKGFLFFAILFAAAVGTTVGTVLFDDFFRTHRPSAREAEEQMIKGFKAASDLNNKKGPTMIAQDTRLDRSEVGPGARLTYFYTLPNHSSLDVDASKFQEATALNTIKTVCSRNEMRPLLKLGAIYGYSYFGKDGKKIASFEIRINDCKE